MAQLASTINVDINNTQKSLRASGPENETEALSELLTQLHTERRELKASWAQAESRLLPNQRRKFRMHGPKLAV